MMRLRRVDEVLRGSFFTSNLALALADTFRRLKSYFYFGDEAANPRRSRRSPLRPEDLLQSFRASAYPHHLPLSPLIVLKPSVELLGGQLSESARAEADLVALQEPKPSGRAWKSQSEET